MRKTRFTLYSPQGVVLLRHLANEIASLYNINGVDINFPPAAAFLYSVRGTEVQKHVRVYHGAIYRSFIEQRRAAYLGFVVQVYTRIITQFIRNFIVRFIALARGWMCSYERL